MHLNKIRQVHTFGHPHQYLLQPPFVKITASRRFLLPLMSVWFLDEGILDHSSLQNISSSVRFDGCLAWTARFNSSHRFSIIFKSGLGWPFQEIILVPLHSDHPLSCPHASLFPPCAFLCLFVYAMCPLVVVRVSTPHLFPISRFVCIIGFTCVLLIPLV